VRRAKLYYLRDLRGKKARIRERRVDETKLAAQQAARAEELGAADVEVEAEAEPAEAGDGAAEPVEGDASEADETADASAAEREPTEA
jgi:hypothetical protein